MRLPKETVLAALCILISASAALADTSWRSGTTCGSGTVVAKLTSGRVASWCPGNVTTASKPMTFASPTICQFSGTAGKNVVVKGAINTVARWIAPAATACDYAATPVGPCSFFAIEAGEIVTMELDSGDTNAQVSCSAGDDQ